MRSLMLAPLALLLAAGSLAAQERGRDDSTFVWSGAMAPGTTLSLRNIAGEIEVREASGATAEVRAEKRWNGRANPRDIAFDVRVEGKTTSICTVWRGDSPCDGNDRHNYNSDDDERVSVRFTVTLPKGVALLARTGNGAVSVEKASAAVEASSGNGRVRVSDVAGDVVARSGNGDVAVDRVTGQVSARSGNGDVRVSTASGPVNASSGNGTIRVRMDALKGDGDMEFRTGNGSVILELPKDFAGEIDASQGGGAVRSDFPITLSGPVNLRHLRGTIAGGGRRVRLSSGNGGIELRKID
ncbi:MAG: DUF4097 family beta strand repeat-containing protein [Gemmatimonadaceae bacterium]